MRVKRSVDFRMAPKKTTKGKGTAAEPTHDEGWEPSKCSRSDLESLVKQGFLASESVIQWRPVFGDTRSYENTGKIIGFVLYFERVLVFPALISFLDFCIIMGSSFTILLPILLCICLSSYIYAKRFWASSPILNFSVTFSILSLSPIRLV